MIKQLFGDLSRRGRMISNPALVTTRCCTAQLVNLDSLSGTFVPKSCVQTVRGRGLTKLYLT